jgi:hypothetical protein
MKYNNNEISICWHWFNTLAEIIGRLKDLLWSLHLTIFGKKGLHYKNKKMQESSKSKAVF